MTIENDSGARVRDDAGTSGTDRRQGDRRGGRERRGGLRWDPLQTDRRTNGDRRAPTSREWGQTRSETGITSQPGSDLASP